MLHDKIKIHFIGICGVAMSALALALKKAGYEVTGSDVGIYPPISTYLKESGVDYYTGWHPDRVLRSFSEGGKDGNLVVVGNVASSNNPEWLYVQENKLNYKSYPEVIKEFFVKENSIVCAGTYGKTTSSSLLTWILKQNNFDPTYMFGGISLNGIPSASLGDNPPRKNPSGSRGNYSVIEGDEYKSARWDNGPKFAHYSPTHLLLTSVVWDHADVYPTEQSYVDAFQTLVNNIPANGMIVTSEKVSHITYHISHIIKYGKSPDNDYQYTNVKTSKNGLSFDIVVKPKNDNLKPKTYNLITSNLGDYMADNMTGCFAFAHELGIEPANIIKAIISFKNIKRRLEKRCDNDVIVFDDIAHSPKKAEAVLASLKNIYTRHPERSEFDASQTNEVEGSPSSKLIAVFEPNGGNRQIESIPGYDNAFVSADEVIIPRLTAIKQDPNKPEVMDGQKLAEVISKTHNNAKYIDDDTELINYLINNTKSGDVIVFCGSHGFRGMIDSLIKGLKSRKG
ncbi:MAG: Mur ligase domain-containing protein [Candidatus Magasanikiibacteriota bacterium]